MADDNVIPLPRGGPVEGEIVAEDVASLAREFPEWEFGTSYITANSGPDARFLWARRERQLITAWSRAALACQVRDQQPPALP
jgi:hypothetical protein